MNKISRFKIKKPVYSLYLNFVNSDIINKLYFIGYEKLNNRFIIKNTDDLGIITSNLDNKFIIIDNKKFNVHNFPRTKNCLNNVDLFLTCSSITNEYDYGQLFSPSSEILNNINIENKEDWKSLLIKCPYKFWNDLTSKDKFQNNNVIQFDLYEKIDFYLARYLFTDKNNNDTELEG